MKMRLFILGMFACASIARAGHAQASELVSVFEAAVNTAAHGDLSRAMHQLNVEAQSPKSLNELNAQTDQIRQTYDKLAQLGELDRVERVSLVFTGESFFRLRLAEKRADGVILWTLVGYRFKGQWYSKGINITGSTDLLSLLHDNLDPADATPPPK